MQTSTIVKKKKQYKTLQPASLQRKLALCNSIQFLSDYLTAKKVSRHYGIKHIHTRRDMYCYRSCWRDREPHGKREQWWNCL